MVSKYEGSLTTFVFAILRALGNFDCRESHYRGHAYNRWTLAQPSGLLEFSCTFIDRHE